MDQLENWQNDSTLQLSFVAVSLFSMVVMTSHALDLDSVSFGFYLRLAVSFSLYVLQ